jgi:hypothetical protein
MEMAMDRKITASHTASWVWKRAACALSVLAFMSAAHAETTLEKIQHIKHVAKPAGHAASGIA